MVVSRGDIKRKRKDDSCMSMLDESPKRTKVHAQRKFAQGSNVSSPVITPVKEIERQERNKDVLPEPIELLPMKRPNTDDFLTFLCFRGTPILPPDLNFFNTASMIDSRSQTEEPKTFYPKNGPILTTATKSQNDRPFIAFGVRKRADPIVISKQMDRKRRHALALQALRRKYQEQKMAKIRAVTISKLSEKVTSKNIVRTRSITKNETSTKRAVTHKPDIKLVAIKHISTKPTIKQPIKSKMCLRSFRGKYIHRELNIRTHKKRSKVGRRPIKVCATRDKERGEKSSSEFSSDDDEPLMKTLKSKSTKKTSTVSAKKSVPSVRKPDENNIRLTRSRNKLNTQPQKKPSRGHRRIITRFANNLRPTTTRIKNKKIAQASNIVKNVKRPISSMKREKTQKVTKFIRSTRQHILKDTLLNLDVKRTRNRGNRLASNSKEQIECNNEDLRKSLKGQSLLTSNNKEEKECKKEDSRKNFKSRSLHELPNITEKLNTKINNIRSTVSKETNDSRQNLNVKTETKDTTEKPNVSETNDRRDKPSIKSEANNKKEKQSIKMETNQIKEKTNTKQDTNSKKDKPIVDLEAKDKKEKSNIRLETNEKNEKAPTIKLDKTLKKNDKFEPKTKILRKSSSTEKLIDNSTEYTKDTKKNTKGNSMSFKIEKMTVADEKTKICHPKEKNVQDIVKCRNNSKKIVDKISNLRPSRKTKEAAAIYMELLGQKLVNDTEIDDDNISIDSFPELPNVRRTEQRENELKAKAKSKVVNNKSATCKNKIENKDVSVTSINDKKTQHLTTDSSKTPNKKIAEINASVNNESNIKHVQEDKKISVLIEESKSKNNVKNIILEGDTQILTVTNEESFDVADKCKIYKQLNPNSTNDSAQQEVLSNQINSEINESKSTHTVVKNGEELGNVNASESDEDNKITPAKSKNSTKHLVKKNQLDSFSDSDEEPLSNLTKSRYKIKKPEECENVHTQNVKVLNESDVKNSKSVTEKPKRECAKKPQNYLPFSSSDDEEKYFHGFVKSELKTLKDLKTDNTEVCPHSLPSDLSCKDVSRRYGKGKVNMSNEQIEKWLNDSAIAGMNIKKEEDDLLKFEEKISLDSSMQEIIVPEIKKSFNTKLDEKNFKNTDKEHVENLSTRSTPETQTKPVVKSTSNERKTIFRKEKTEPIRNVNAFSVSNECSVYAFEADNEDSISTPFRRPCRRPSSTATSKSEDETKIDEISKHPGKFRLPTMLRSDIKLLNKQEQSHAADESSNSNIGVQVNFENHTFTDNSNSEPPSVTEDTDHIFYSNVQSNKHISLEAGIKASTSKAIDNTQQKLFTKSKAGAQLKTLQKTNERSMFPPGNVMQKVKADNKTLQKHMFNNKCSDKNSEISEDIKYKIPSSPSASSSSSAKLYKRQNTKARNRIHELCTPINSTEFPSSKSTSQIVEAPVFHPSEKEFQDPLEYIEKIRSKAEKFGICRIVPPTNFKPECKVSDDMRFTAYNQYIHKMLHRWGPNFKELIAIRKYLETQNITLTHPPWIGGMEIDLPRLYQTVQSLGGLKEVIEKKKWAKVSEAMKIPKSAQDRVTKLDDIYCKYLLPYDTLSPAEREKLFDEVETEWAKRESKTLLKVQRVTKLDSTTADVDSDSDNESEECIVKGRNIALNAFYRIARNTMSMWFRTAEPLAEEVEQEFWKHVTLKNNHICVHSGSIDSGNWGYGFAVSKNSPFARHAWNLKVLTNNSGSVLRSMGPVMGVTVPTLHVGMVFSACCWYRDPHSLPWIEYLHTGGHKIWYAIPDSMSKQFHATMLKLVPNYCRNKSVWLPSDTVMIPPKLLVENGVSLCRTVQEPGQFIVVFPKVFTSSISTGYVVSESVYFAPLYWLQSARSVFNELRENCEPSMFSIDRLLLSITSDTRSSVEVLKQILPAIQDLCNRERNLREKLKELGLNFTEKLPPPETPAVRKRKKLQQESGDYECEVCRINLFISLVNEVQDDVVYCLEHVIEHIEEKKVDIKNCKLLFTYDCEELDSLIDKIKNAIEIKLQKKNAVKVSLS